MKKYILFLLFILISFAMFTACEKDDNKKDKEKPIISEVKVAWNDTIWKSDGSIIHINTDTLNVNRIDTMLTGRRVNLSVRFTDNNALSAYMVKIRFNDNLDPLIPVDTDTLFTYRESWADIFGEKDMVVKQREIIIPDSIYKVIQNRNINLPLREGKYAFTVLCVDKGGNEDSLVHDVQLLYPKTVLTP